jgi:hypothetical protein
MEKSLAQVAFEAYGEEPGPKGPWTTFDGRPMPKWEELNGEGGALTQHRWDVAIQAAISEHERRKTAPPPAPHDGMEWDALAFRWVEKGPKRGPAIAPHGNGA